ncbi:hypothetical protein [Saccharibacillus alkalitolerans]|uniref:DUF4181 domain-containing protein n=1 Tax=Saccharibacillus alkalitolerans TaxID=2705290 RepID=A0ABX0F623_9BACL|nr:hypothetical protein [Saccharibacillus alkalitolerans]NGZ74999.1 hypothetical protein [Saccharibacillus alkalitolerans]
MNPTSFPIIAFGNLIVILLVHAVFPRFIVTGPDRRQMKDVPRLKRYTYGLTFGALALLGVVIFGDLPPVQTDLLAFAIVLSLGLIFMYLEKKYLPNTRRHLVTLCWIGCFCAVCGLYAWATYF